MFIRNFAKYKLQFFLNGDLVTIMTISNFRRVSKEILTHFYCNKVISTVMMRSCEVVPFQEI